jgi:hypothetical protein
MSGIKLSKLSKLVLQMNSKDPERRFNAMSKLHDYDSYYLEESAVIIALGLATTKFEHSSLQDWDDPCYCIITFIHSYIIPDHIEVIEECFEDYTPRAKSLILHQMLELCTKESIKFFIDNFDNVLNEDKEFTPELKLASENPEVADLLFPFLFKYSKDDKLKYSIIELFTEYIKLDSLNVNSFEGFSIEIKNVADSLYEEIMPYNGNFNHEFVYLHWNEKYPLLRNALKNCIYLLSKIDYEQHQIFINKCLELNDPVFITEAIISKINNNDEADERYYDKISNDPYGILHLVKEFSYAKIINKLPTQFTDIKKLNDYHLHLEILIELGLKENEFELSDDIVVNFTEEDGEDFKLRFYKIKINNSEYEDDGWMYVAVEFCENIEMINSFLPHLFLTKDDEATPEALTDELKDHRINVVETYVNLPHTICHPNLRYSLFGVYFASTFLINVIYSITNIIEIRYINIFLFFVFFILIGFNYLASKRIEVSHGPSYLQFKIGKKIKVLNFEEIGMIELDNMLLPLSKKSSLTDFKEEVIIFRDKDGNKLDIIPKFLCDDLDELVKRIKSFNPDFSFKRD